MTTAAICATREVSWSPSFYRGEQFDSDLGLYYLRARYMNPLTGRFLSRDPLDGNAKDPATLHKYAYAGGDPVNLSDPTGRNFIGFALPLGLITMPSVATVVATSGALDCFGEFILTKFDGAIEIAMHGGTITQVGPCVWLFANVQKTLTQTLAPAQPVPGTPVTPWPPECNELGAAVQAAKALAYSLGKCSEGMHPSQLQSRFDAWIGLGNARDEFNDYCWNGGNSGHQNAADTAWENAGNCAEIKESF